MEIFKISSFNNLPKFFKRFLNENKIKSEYKSWLSSEAFLSKMWEQNHNYVPVPHYVKQRTIKVYAQKYSLKAFVETGTYFGKMLESIKNDFDIVISIELSESLALRAKEIFISSPHIEIIQGNSGEKISLVLEKLNQSALFWLDGHYSGGVTAKADVETPILSEVKSILEHPNRQHILLIDDARLFNGTRDYPTHEELRKFVSIYSANFTYEVENDIIKIIRN
jgi:hypothetical protein